MPFQQETA